MPFDLVSNPNVIVLTYQYDTIGQGASTFGGRAETKIGRTLKASAGYVNDTSGAGNVTIASQEISGALFGGQIDVVHASSSGMLLSSASSTLPSTARGGALHGSYTRTAGQHQIAFTYDRTGMGYDDPFGGLSTPGLLNEHLTYGHTFAGGTGSFGLDVSHEANVGVGQAGNVQNSAVASVRRVVNKRLTVNASVGRTTQSSGQTSSVPALIPGTSLSSPDVTPGAQASTQASFGADWRITPRLDFGVNRLQTLSGTNDVQPTQTDGQVTWDLGAAGRAYVRERWSAAPLQSFAQATQGFTASTGGTQATEFGFERRISSAMSIDTEWAVDHTGSGTDIYAAQGVKERFAFGKVRGDATFQHATAVGGDAQGGFDLYGSTLSYAAPNNRFRASESTQLRTGVAAGFSFQVSAAGALGPDFSLLASLMDARAAGVTQADERVGLAWRPSQSDAGVTLLQYERQAGTAVDTGTESGVLSLEQVYRPRPRTELVGRVAYVVDGDAQYAAHSSLMGLRLDQRVSERWDVGAEIRRTSVAGIVGAQGSAFALESGLRVADSTRVAIGYNFSATADPALATTPVHKGFYLTLTSVVNCILGWGR